jgi:inner membrane protein
MDPLTHTLVGAGLAATRLGQKTPLAIPALIIGANLPDIDVLSYLRGEDFALGFRRGWTHGVLALALLPAVLAGLLMLWDRWRAKGNPKPRPSPGWLLALSYLACLTHPSLDWLNNYGMRWWMPFQDTWYYGDSVFIMDPWLWLILGLGWLISRRPSLVTGVIVILMVALVAWLVGSRAPAYLPTVGSIFAVLLMAYFWRPKGTWLTAHRTASIGLVAAALFIASMLTIHSLTLSRVARLLPTKDLAGYSQLFAGPTPANPLAWDIVVGTDAVYRWGRFDWRHADTLVMSKAELPAARRASQWKTLVASDQHPGFLSWTRFPWLQTEQHGRSQSIHLMDARYARHRTDGFGGAVFEIPAD